MDEDDADVLGQGVEAEPYGVLAGVAACDDEDLGAVGHGVFGEDVLHAGDVVGRSDDHDEGHGAGGGHGPYGVDEHGCAAQRAERLGSAGAEPYALAGGRDHRCGTGRTRLVRHRLHSGRFVSSADMGMAWGYPRP